MPDAVLSPTLTALAHAHGVATEYWDWEGHHVHVAPDTIRAVLAALGVDAEDDELARHAAAELLERPWRRVVPPTVVCRAGRPTAVLTHLPAGAVVQVEVELEDGGVRALGQPGEAGDARRLDDVDLVERSLELPADLPLGWHRLRVRGDGADVDPTGVATLVVTPEVLDLPEALRDRRSWGLMEQVYQVRSDRSWGIGDLADLGVLAAFAGAELGADFVLVNPLHAAEPIAPMEPSPYLPTTRRYANPVYLSVDDIPELAAAPADVRERVAASAATARPLNHVDTIDRDAVWAAKRAALLEIYRCGLDEPRQAAFEAYCQDEGDRLLTFATWCALADEHGLPWKAWAAPLRDPLSAEVAAFRESNQQSVDFHRWLQWLLDEQLAGVQRKALGAGMSLGVVHDLAVGVSPDGADAWGLADVLGRRVSVGAPPDQFNQLGQDWNQPPWRPDRLAEVGYAPYRDMLRGILRDSGGIRVDHILGLFRLWWVPEGEPASAGTYVRYDHEALVGILVLEAQRAGAVVVGEDLGVVEPWVRDYMGERGVLGTSIVWFEWEDGRLRAPETYRELCLSTVTTHDLPPTAGYLALDHVALRDRLHLLTRPVEEEREVEQGAIDTVRAVLVGRGLLTEGAGVPETVEALHLFLAETPSRMLGVAVTDLVGDVRPINQPGTQDEYPNWRLPLAGPDGSLVGLEQVLASPLAARLARVLGTQR